MPDIRNARAPELDGSAVAPRFFEENVGRLAMAVLA
jgi:hypothetical protein